VRGEFTARFVPMAASGSGAEIIGVHINHEKRAKFFEQSTANLNIVKREALADAEDAEKSVEQIYAMQEGERHRFDLLVHLVQQSIHEKRVLEQDELDRVKRLQWNEAAAALAASRREAQGRDASAQAQGRDTSGAPVTAPMAASGASGPAHAPLLDALPATSEAESSSQLAVPETEGNIIPRAPLRKRKQLASSIRKLVQQGKAAEDPHGEELQGAQLESGMLIWGEFVRDGVWYPGQVKADVKDNVKNMVLYDDGDEDLKLDENIRRYRLRGEYKRQRRDTDAAPTGTTEAAIVLASAIDAPPKVEPEAPMPPPLAPAIAVTSSEWQVFLGGKFIKYEDSAVQRTLEETLIVQGHREVCVIVHGEQYEVAQSGDFASSGRYEQRRVNDRSKTRAVRRLGAGVEQPSSPAVPLSTSPPFPPMPAAALPPATLSAAAPSAAMMPPAAGAAAPPGPASFSGSAATAPSTAFTVRSSWWSHPERLKDDEKVWPKRIPDPDVQLLLGELEASGSCPLLSYVIWDMCHADKTAAQVNQCFRELCLKCNVLVEGFRKIGTMERDAKVQKSGSDLTYPQHNSQGQPPPPGSGIHPTRHGTARMYSTFVAQSLARGGNGGSRANAIQDFIENIVLSGRAESITGLTGQPNLSFLLAMPEKEQKKVLHDLTVIKNPDSKTVKHGIDMIRHWKANGSFSSGMQSYMRETLEEEVIKVDDFDEKERQAKLDLLKLIK